MSNVEYFRTGNILTLQVFRVHLESLRMMMISARIPKFTTRDSPGVGVLGWPVVKTDCLLLLLPPVIKKL